MNSLMHTVSSDIHRTNWRRVAWVAAAAVTFAILAAIILPGIGGLSPAANEAMNRRNAQSVVAVYRGGAEAGVIWNGKTRMDRIKAVCSGQTPDNGAYAGKRFRVGLGAPALETHTYRYIGMDAKGDLFYDVSGGQSGS